MRYLAHPLLWRGIFHALLGTGFIVLYIVSGIYWATAATMVGVTVEIVAVKLAVGYVRTVEVAGAALLLGLGSFTLLLHDATYVEMRPTVIYWVIAVSLTLLRVVRGTEPVEKLLDRWIAADQYVWIALRRTTVTVLTVLGAMNLVVALIASTDAWMIWRLVAAYVLLPIAAFTMYLRHRRSITRRQRATSGSA